MVSLFSQKLKYAANLEVLLQLFLLDDNILRLISSRAKASLSLELRHGLETAG